MCIRDSYVDACGHRWTTLGLARVDVQPTLSAGIRLQIHPVPVARLYRLCYILWTIVQIWNSPAVCQPCIWLRRRLSPGSACRAHAKKKNNRTKVPTNAKQHHKLNIEAAGRRESHKHATCLTTERSTYTRVPTLLLTKKIQDFSRTPIKNFLFGACKCLNIKKKRHLLTIFTV